MFEQTFRVREYDEGEPFRAAGLEVLRDSGSRTTRCETYGFRVTNGARSLAYSGDSGPSERLAELARGCDLFVCEATLERPELDGEPRGHLSADEAVAAFEASGAERLLLTHRPHELPLDGGPRARLRRARDRPELARAAARCAEPLHARSTPAGPARSAPGCPPAPATRCRSICPSEARRTASSSSGVGGRRLRRGLAGGGACGCETLPRGIPRADEPAPRVPPRPTGSSETPKTSGGSRTPCRGHERDVERDLDARRRSRGPTRSAPGRPGYGKTGQLAAHPLARASRRAGRARPAPTRAPGHAGARRRGRTRRRSRPPHGASRGVSRMACGGL